MNMIVWAKAILVSTQTEFYFIVPSLPMHAHCLHWLMSIGLLYADHVYSQVMKWYQ